MKLGYWKTRGGLVARVLCNDGPGFNPIVGYIECRTTLGLRFSMPQHWDSSGAVYSSFGDEQDLVEFLGGPDDVQFVRQLGGV